MYLFFFSLWPLYKTFSFSTRSFCFSFFPFLSQTFKVHHRISLSSSVVCECFSPSTTRGFSAVLEHNKKLCPTTNTQHRDKETIVPEGGSLLATQKKKNLSFTHSPGFSIFFCKRVISHDISSIAYQPNRYSSSLSYPTLRFFFISFGWGWGSVREPQHGPSVACVYYVVVCWPFKLHHGSKNTPRIKPKTQLAFLFCTFFFLSFSLFFTCYVLFIIITTTQGWAAAPGLSSCFQMGEDRGGSVGQTFFLNIITRFFITIKKNLTKKQGNRDKKKLFNSSLKCW